MIELMNQLNFAFPYIIRAMALLSIVALGGLFSERSGVVNIALEGIMIMGAFAGAWTMIIVMNNMNIPLQWNAFIGLSVGAITGMVFSLFHAFAAIHMKSNQIISATALNFFAPAFAIFTARSVTGDRALNVRLDYAISEVPILSNIPILGPWLFTNAYLSTYLAVIIFIVAYIVLYKTPFGLRLRSCGENPHAADSLGVNIYKIRYAGVMISGALAGLGGVMFVLSFSTRFDGAVAGFGFLALAVLISGQWKPIRLILIAFLFALFRVISEIPDELVGIRNLNLPQEIWRMLPFIATLVILAITSKGSAAPRAVGEPFDAGKR